MPKPTLPLVALAIVVTAPTLLAQTLVPDPPKVCDSCAEWNAPREPVRLHGETYYVGTAGLSSVVVRTPAGLALFDGALPQSAAVIAGNLEKLNLRLADVRFIFNSHAHYDHAGGIAALQRASGATVVASARGAEALERGGPTEDDPQFGLGVSVNAFPRVAEVRRVRHGETIVLGQLSITAHETPGHTPGSTSWSWRSCEGSDCLDVVYADSLTAVSSDDFRYTGTPAENFALAIERVGKLPCGILIAPHPGAVDLFAKLERSRAGAVPDPLRDPNACANYAAAARTRLDKRLADEAAASARPVPSNPSSPSNPSKDPS